MPLSEFEEKILFSTVRISIAEKNGIGSSIGTGFIVSAPVPGKPSQSALLLISNRHVFGDPTGKISLSFTRRKKNEIKPDLGQIQTITQSDFSGGYTGHPNPRIDLACINISTFGEPEIGIYFRHLPSVNFPEMTEDTLVVGSDIWFIGYPENRFDVVHNIPIFRKGCIASPQKLDFNGEKQFLIDAQVFPGSSGSPVFAAIGGEYKVIGVVSATMIKDQMLQAAPVSITYFTQQVIGLGIVLKISLLNELINTAVLRLAS